MPILFNTLLNEACLPLSDVRLLRHLDHSAEKDQSDFRDERGLKGFRMCERFHWGFDQNHHAGDGGSTELAAVLELGWWLGRFIGILATTLSLLLLSRGQAGSGHSFAETAFLEKIMFQAFDTALTLGLPAEPSNGSGNFGF